MFVGTDDNYAKVPSANDIGGGEGNDNDEASNKESENGKGKETITKEATSVSSDSLAFKHYKYAHLRFLRRWAQFLLAAMQIHILYFLKEFHDDSHCRFLLESSILRTLNLVISICGLTSPVIFGRAGRLVLARFGHP